MHTSATMLLRAILLISLNCVMGNRFPRMYKSSDAQLGDFPHTVYIQTRNIYCSGTIISRKWVLTAGHCIDPKNSPKGHRIFAGIVSYYNRPLPETAQIRTGKTVIIHPDYQLFNATNNTDIGSFNDLGLIKTNQSFKFNEFVNKAILSKRSPYGMLSCQAVGFGNSEYGPDHIMRFINVREILPCLNVSDNELKTLYTNDFHICSYPNNTESELRNGDSGGPLVCPGNLLVGVAFWGKPQIEEPFVMLHVNVASFITWIRRSTQESIKPKE